MPIEDIIRLDAEIVAIVGQQLFRARLGNGHELIAHTARRDNLRAAELQVGMMVRLEMSPFDMSEGRIKFPDRPLNLNERTET